jgi:NAD(P)-dependent dehydrogenase (short-subunit alcohol dehydrogenase family)
LIARGGAGLRGAVSDTRDLHACVHAVEADVAQWAEVEHAAADIERALGPIDVWINAAMTSVFAPFWEMEPDEFRRVTEVTYLGVVHGTRAALDRMLPRDRGTIVQVGSALAYRGIPLQSAYCGSKHAVQGFSEAVRCELMHDGRNVRITQVMLPAVNTPQFDWVLSRLPHRAQPVPPIYQPETVARTILYAAEHPKREYWVTKSTARAIIANKFAAGVLDHLLARTGFSSQQTDAKRDPNAPTNLWTAVDHASDYGAHGRFDDQTSGRDWWERVRFATAPATPLLQWITERGESFVAALFARANR